MRQAWMDRWSCAGCARVPSRDEIVSGMCAECAAPLEFVPDPHGVVDTSCGGPWRYRAFLPCSYRVELDPGTPPRVVRSVALEEALHVSEVWLVDCTRLGTGTFKDLEAQVCLSAARDLGIGPLAVYSTGNTARAYHEWSRRIDAECAVMLPAAHLDKVRGCESTARQPIISIPRPPAIAARSARAIMRRRGARNLGPTWKVEGAAAVAYAIAEHCPNVNVIAQAIGSGYGPIGYELGLRRAARLDIFAGAPVVHDHRYLLVQPADAAIMVAAWSDPNGGPPDPKELPADPFEPTLQSTSGPATIDTVRALPIEAMVAVEPDRVASLRTRIDGWLAEAQIDIDYERERSTHIAIAGLVASPPQRAARLAIIVTGASAIGG